MISDMYIFKMLAFLLKQKGGLTERWKFLQTHQ